MIRKKITLIALVILALGLAGYGGLRLAFRCSVDPPTGAITLPGITGTVVIRRDALGIPLIEAANEPDLYFATGYAQASDRLWQMVFMRMVMQGRLAEIIGAGGLDFDIAMRSLHARRYVDEAMARLRPGTRALLEAYSRGVNAYIETHRILPPEFILTRHRPEPWKPEDCFYVFGLLNMSVSGNLIEELGFLLAANRLGYGKAAVLFPVYPDEPLPLAEARKLAGIETRDLAAPLDRLSASLRSLTNVMPMNKPASNNWAVAGSRTKSGRPIVTNDTHLDLMIPNSWMIMHLKCPTLDVAGVMAPGLPIVCCGFNGSVAWGATMVMADSQDLFLEKLKTDGGSRSYLYKGAWRPVSMRTETFRVAGGETVRREFASTIHGPLFNEALERMPFPPEMPVQTLPMKSSYGLALSWALEGGSDSLEGFLALGRARSMAEARAALLRVKSIYLNIVYGDRTGIAWQVTGLFPTRRAGTGQFPSPGWDGAHDWTGFVPMERNPSSLNPAEGYIGTANNRTVSANHPFVMSTSWFGPDRADRIAQVLSGTRTATAESMHALHFDRYSRLAAKMQRLLSDGPLAERVRASIARLSDEEKRRAATQALAMLAPTAFDCVMRPESANAALYGAFVHTFTRATFLDELGPDDSVVWESFVHTNMISYSAIEDHLQGREDSPFWNDVGSGGREDKADILAESLARAYALCGERMGGDPKKWQWGALHTYHWRHEFAKKLPILHGYFNRGPHPAGGDGQTVNVAAWAPGKNFDTWLIPAMRLVVDFGLADPAFLVTVPGQSGNPSSVHYGDMIEHYLTGKNHPLPFATKAIDAQYADRLELKPR